MSSAPKRYKRDSKSISSGNFMLSNTKLYDNDVLERSVASPDTTHNEDSVNEDTDNVKKNNNLTKLTNFIKLYHRSNLNTPKWKNFDGFDLQVKDKVRLNNAIWRTWYQQYSIKNDFKRKKSLICQFFKNDRTLFDSTDSLVVSEGKYWRRNSDTISNEYKKWRSFVVKNKNKTPSNTSKINSLKDSNVSNIEEMATKEFSDDLNQSYNILSDSDPVFDSNSDLFQPDLLRFFPNFDFLFDFDDLENEDIKALRSLTSTTNDEISHSVIPSNSVLNNQNNEINQKHYSSNLTAMSDDTNLVLPKDFEKKQKCIAKRKHNIENGFSELQEIVPDSINSSKSAILQKTCEHIRKLKASRYEFTTSINNHKNEIEILSNQINELQNELPETGVSSISIDINMNRNELLRQKFKSYVQTRTVENWKFQIFSTILTPLFENYLNNVKKASREEILNWQSEYLNLANLRSLLSSNIRNLSKSTSVLSNPEILRFECYKAAIQIKKK